MSMLRMTQQLTHHQRVELLKTPWLEETPADEIMDINLASMG